MRTRTRFVYVQGCCSDAEAQQAGRFHTTSQAIQCELPTIPVQIGSHLLRGVSFNESASDNLKLKTVTTDREGLIYLITADTSTFSVKIQVLLKYVFSSLRDMLRNDHYVSCNLSLFPACRAADDQRCSRSERRCGARRLPRHRRAESGVSLQLERSV